MFFVVYIIVIQSFNNNMTKKEALQIIKEHNKKDGIYTTYVSSSEDYNGFLKQCKRAVNKMQCIPDASVKHEFFSKFATEQADRYYSRMIKDNYLYPNSPLGMERMTEYENIAKMSNWEYLRKYGELSVQDGWHCVDFEFGGIVFAGLSQGALTEMGVFTNEDCRLFLDALDITERYEDNKSR